MASKVATHFVRLHRDGVEAQLRRLFHHNYSLSCQWHLPAVRVRDVEVFRLTEVVFRRSQMRSSSIIPSITQQALSLPSNGDKRSDWPAVTYGTKLFSQLLLIVLPTLSVNDSISDPRWVFHEIVRQIGLSNSRLTVTTRFQLVTSSCDGS